MPIPYLGIALNRLTESQSCILGWEVDTYFVSDDLYKLSQNSKLNVDLH